MACGCSDSGCNCFLSGANGISITGNGAQGNPYVISAPASSNDAVTVVATNYTITTANHTIIVNSTAAPVNVKLPAAASVGERYEIKDYGATGLGNTTVNAVTIDPNGNTIDGLLTPYTLIGDGDSITVVWIGTGWAVV